jgi:NAD(P)-dependent dehydrogenase (short-subunit alcohol dehydrogenase family)
MTVVVVAGANVGLGGALAAAFRPAAVVALGRAAATAAVAKDVPGTMAIECELTDADAVDRAFTEVERSLATPDVVIYNAHRIELGSALDTPAESFTDAWRVGCLGAFLVARRVVPRMLERGSGTLLFTGATGSIRGGKRSAAFASAKFALRGLAQALARELGPRGIHVAHIVIDGVVWCDRSRARFDARAETSMDPHEIARTYRHVVDQHPTAWTHELDLRPHHGRF